MGVPRGEPATRYAALSAGTARRRRCSDSGHYRISQPVRSLRLPPDHGVVAARRLAGGQGPSREDLASRRAEGSTKAEAARAAVVQRWVVCPAAAGAGKPCVEL